MECVMRRSLGCVVLAIGTLVVGVAPCLAGPPFLTDDPEPVELRHNEFYVFGSLDHADGASAIAGPAIEYNRGIAPNTQFHIVLPMAWNVPNRGVTATGLGDIELGIKYRLVGAGDGSWQIGIFPMMELATSNARRGLGNGRTCIDCRYGYRKRWAHGPSTAAAA